MIWVNPDLFVFIICVVCVKTSTKLRNSELSLWWVRHSPGRGQFLCLQKSRFSSQFWFLKFLLSPSEEKIRDRERQIEDIILMNHLYWILWWSPQFCFVSLIFLFLISQMSSKTHIVTVSGRDTSGWRSTGMCYLGDVCGCSGVCGLCSEGLRAQQQTCRRIRVCAALEHTHINICHLINTRNTDLVLMCFCLRSQLYIFWWMSAKLPLTLSITTHKHSPHPWSFICESLPHHRDLLTATHTI